MTATRLTPEAHPAGTRVLVRNGPSRYADLYEAMVMEWSPAGRVRLSFSGGVEDWREEIPFFVEALPAKQPKADARLVAFDPAPLAALRPFVEAYRDAMVDGAWRDETPVYLTLPLDVWRAAAAAVRQATAGEADHA
jgi:hypothetical protein